MRRHPKPKRFIPTHPEKYVGDVSNIICRSGIELRYFKYFDMNPAIVKYASEEISINYYSPVDRKMHRYFPDFMVQVLGKDGKKRNYLLEIKSSSDTVPPVKGKRATKNYLAESATWAINTAKWHAAKEFCKKYNMTFMVLSEKEIAFKF